MPKASRSPQEKGFSIRIPLHQLDAGEKELDYELESDWLQTLLDVPDVSLRPDAPKARLSLRLQKSGQDVLVRGELRAELQLVCGRCLEPTPVQVEEAWSLMMVPARTPAKGGKRGGRSAAANEEVDIDLDEMDVETFSGDELVMDEIVREQLLLALPMQAYCEEPCVLPTRNSSSKSS